MEYNTDESELRATACDKIQKLLLKSARGEIATADLVELGTQILSELSTAVSKLPV